MLHKIGVAGSWLHVIWIVSVIGMVLVLVFGSEPVQRQAGDIYVVRTLWLLAAALLMMAIAGFLAVIVWWLRTWRNERLRPALVFLARHVPCFAILATATSVSMNLEHRFKWPSLLTFAMTLAVMFAIGIPWWRWAYPAIESALLQASHGALRASVVLAIPVIVLTGGGAWAFVYH